MPKYQPIHRGVLFTGADRDLQFTIKDSAGSAVNITGMAFEWALWDKDKTAKQLTLVTPTQVELTDPANGVLKVHVKDSDTDSLTGDLEYFYVLRRTDTDDEVVNAYGECWLTDRAKTA